MDRLEVNKSGKPLQIRSGHTPVNIGLMVGSLVAAVPALITESTRSRAVDNVLPLWAAYLFYTVLLLGAGLSLHATYRQLPSRLDQGGYRVIVGRLIRERVGHYAVTGILLCFSISALTASGWNGLSAASWLFGISGGLLCRARQTHVDVRKLHRLVDEPRGSDSLVLADPDDAS